MVSYLVPPDNRTTQSSGHLLDHTEIADDLSFLKLITPSGDATGATDVAAINTALSGSLGTARLSPGTFYIDSPILVGQFQTLSGFGPGQTVVNQVSTTANGVDIGSAGGTIVRPTVAGIEFNGPNSGSGTGIVGGGSSNVIVGATISNVICNEFGASGLAMSAVITSTFDSVNCSSNGSAGIYLYGSSSATTPTSCTLRNCYCDNNVAWGFFISDCNYMALLGCASDTNTNGYEISTGMNVSLVGCGCENTKTSDLDGTSFKVSGGTGHSLTSCFSVDNPAAAFWVTSSATGCSLISCQEYGPAEGATASFKTDSGTSAVIINPTLVTAASYSSGTAYVITATGGTAH